MANEEKMTLYVDLYDNTLTPQEGDFTGRIRITGTLHNSHIAARFVKDRTEYRQETIETILNICDQIKREAIAEGKSVNDGIGQYMATVQGNFIGANAPFDASKHSINVSFAAGKELRELLKNVNVLTHGVATTGPVVNSVTDSTTGVINGTLTSGGPAIIDGKDIKLLGDDPTVGITFTADEVGATPLKVNMIVHNNPSQLTIILPTLDAGKSYWMDLTTQYSGSNKSLKHPRTYRFPLILGKQQEEEEEDRPIVQ